MLGRKASCILDIIAHRERGGVCALQVLFDSPSTTTAPAPPPSAPLPAGLTDAQCAERGDCYFGTSFSRPLQYMFLYHFYGLLWANQFISAFGWGCLPAESWTSAHMTLQA